MEVLKKAVLFKKLKNNEVLCTACSWYCRIPNGSLGICCTRENTNGTLYSLVYGKTTGLGLDPVEKKPFYHLIPGSIFLSFGTVGCNFGCLFCQNDWASQSNKPPANEKDKQAYVCRVIQKLSTTITPRKIVDTALSYHADGIAYTYNEPAIFAEFAHDTAILAKKNHLKNVFVSNGYESNETLNYMKDLIDGINIDLKSFRHDAYVKICKASLEPVLKNIKKVFEAGIETEVTTLVIPGVNDGDKELTDIAQFLYGISPDIPWHISAFTPQYKMTDIPPTPVRTLEKAYEIGRNAGLRYIYVGNIIDWKRSSTYCPKCHSLLVWRRGYEFSIKDFDETKGVCRNCKEKIYGIWH